MGELKGVQYLAAENRLLDLLDETGLSLDQAITILLQARRREAEGDSHETTD